MLCEQIDNVEVIKVFNDPFMLIKDAPQLEFDICILDIEMPGMNGLEVARVLKGKPVIFTTAYKDYAAEAFDIEAIDYIRKPIQKERLEKAIQKACDLLLQPTFEKKFATFNTNKGKTLLFFNEILLITIAENDKRDKLIYLENGDQVILKNMSFDQLLSMLPANDFCRVTKKEVVAIKAVKFFIHNEITTKILTQARESLKINLNESYRKDFLSKLH